jgi:hypothetical protein
MTWADGFTSPLKECMLQIFIALENPLPLAGIEPMNLGFNSKHATHYTTDDNNFYILWHLQLV